MAMKALFWSCSIPRLQVELIQIENHSKAQNLGPKWWTISVHHILKNNNCFNISFDADFYAEFNFFDKNFFAHAFEKKNQYFKNLRGRIKFSAFEH